MGAGLVQDKILKNTNFAKIKCVGFAFGLGIERFSMIYYRIKNIKNFFENILQLSHIF
jgi:phenylalanyl-tRNA synthetase alpha chain